MPSRLTPLVTGEYYHVFNRGLNHMPIFETPADYKRFIKTAVYYQNASQKLRLSLALIANRLPTSNDPYIEILSYSLMPNHYHFLVRQKKDNGISQWLGQLGNSYTKFFNIKHDRSGPLLQGEFKAVHIESQEQLVHVSRYIHLNPIVAYLSNSLESYPWSSFHEYKYPQDFNICDTSTILSYFSSFQEYHHFLLDQISYGRDLEVIKHQLIDT